MKKHFLIPISWEEKTEENIERVGAMYCFKRCDISVN